jgi:TRAP transporter 4TM/12TM fusion protein
MKAALYAIIMSIVCSMIRKNTRISFRDIIDGLEQGARSALGVVAATACAGIIIGVVTQTGLGLKMGTTLVDLAGGRLFLTLFFTMLTSLILGMGVPTTANYVITSTIAAPALLLMDIPILAAHLFAFYFGIIADVTPPVALAAFAGSGIAKSNPLRTGINAFKLAIAAFLVPYVFVYNPSMILIDVTAGGMIVMIITSIIGIIGVASAVSAFLIIEQSLLERVIFFVGGLSMVVPGTYTDAIGIALLLVGFFIQKKKASNRKLGMGAGTAG